ncbi:MAG: DUF4239 domain-containing protein [Pseudolabrys sp.]
MIESWLDLPAAGMFAVLIALYGGAAAAVAWLAFGPAAGARLDGVVPPYFGALAILFALLTSFLAGDIGDRNRQAARAVQTEAGELRNVFTLSVASASDMREIRAAWAGYVKAVVADDWPAMEQGAQGASASAAYDALLREVSDPRIATAAGAAVHAALLNAAVRAGTARTDRLALAADRTNDLKWAVVLILGVLTQAAIGLVHLQKRVPHVAALVLFSAAAVIALGLIGLQEHPFAGAVRIAPAPLQDLLKLAAG